MSRRTSLLACCLSLGAGCLDLTPTQVTPPDTGSTEEAQQRCRECVYGANGSGPSCALEMSRCTRDAACQSALACSFEKACYGQDRSYALTCAGKCQDFVQRGDDPVVNILLPLYRCMMDGPCTAACVPGQMSGARPSEGIPSASAGDASVGRACESLADQAIISRGLTEAATSCGTRCFTSPTADCHIACIANQTELSLACSACWGDTIHCSASRCLPQCLDSSSPACSDCNDLNCTPAFRSCAGSP